MVENRLLPETWRLRQAVLRRYGGRCMCVCGCAEVDLRLLDLDHVRGGGRDARKTLRGVPLYQRLLKAALDPALQLLCVRCHRLKLYFGGCDLGPEKGQESRLPLEGIHADIESFDPKQLIKMAQAMSGDRIRQKIAEHYEDRRNALLFYGGDRPRCACCGSLDSLQIDHVNGGGGAHRAAIAPLRLEAWLRQEGYPDGFQLLCRRCNASKSDSDACHLDHSREIMSDDNALARNRQDKLSKQAAGNTVGSEQADVLVNLNTRVPAYVKAMLQREADARKVAIGVIITEHVTNDGIFRWLKRLEEKLDHIGTGTKDEQPRSAIEDSGASTPPPEPVPDYNYEDFSTFNDPHPVSPDPLPQAADKKRRFGLWRRA